jgi:predicted nucleic acid-binding protein
LAAPLFIDTSALFALADRKDDHHLAATKYLKAVSGEKRRLVTTTDVVDEIITLVRYRIGHAEAAVMGNRMLKSAWLDVTEVNDSLRHAALEIFMRFRDQRLSFTDCTSFAFLRERSLPDAFTFDRADFTVAGFVAVPPA